MKLFAHQLVNVDVFIKNLQEIASYIPYEYKTLLRDAQSIKGLKERYDKLLVGEPVYLHAKKTTVEIKLDVNDFGILQVRVSDGLEDIAAFISIEDDDLFDIRGIYSQIPDKEIKKRLGNIKNKEKIVKTLKEMSYDFYCDEKCNLIHKADTSNLFTEYKLYGWDIKHGRLWLVKINRGKIEYIDI